MYLPFVKAKGQPTLGLQPLALADWIEIDHNFRAQLTYKAELLANRHESVFSALPGSLTAQEETLDLLVAHLLCYFPTMYQSLENQSLENQSLENQSLENKSTEKKEAEGGIYNSKLLQAWRFSDFTAAPLDLAARLVQEDLCLMLPADGSYRLAAASVCFPLRWCLAQKMSQPIGLIHKQVPMYEKRLHRPVSSVFERLRTDFPGVRFNWSVVDSAELHLAASKHTKSHDSAGFDAAITSENAGEKLWLRVERQTLRRLPLSGAILFTIRTYVYPLATVTEKSAIAQQLSDAVQALAPDMQKYKNLLPFRQALLAYLQERAQSDCLRM